MKDDFNHGNELSKSLDILLNMGKPENKEQICMQKLSNALRELTDRVEALENRKARTVREAKPIEYWKTDEFQYSFWAIYPKKIGKSAALKAWYKLKPDNSLIWRMATHFSNAYENTEKCFIPNPATYLNQARWLDEIIEVKPKYLALPKEDGKLWDFAKEWNKTKELEGNYEDKLPMPGQMSYWDYRKKLEAEIESKGLKS